MLSLREVILNRWHKEVRSSLGDGAHDIELKPTSACWDWNLGMLMVDFFDGDIQARCMLVTRHPLVVDNYFSGVK